MARSPRSAAVLRLATCSAATATANATPQANAVNPFPSASSDPSFDEGGQRILLSRPKSDSRGWTRMEMELSGGRPKYFAFSAYHSPV